MGVWSIIWTIILGLLVLGAILVIVSDEGDSGRKLAWLFIIAILPAVGLLLYLIFGMNYRSEIIYKHKHKKTFDVFKDESNMELLERISDRSRNEVIRDDYKPLVRLLQRGYNPPVTNAENLEIITKGSRKFELLMRDLENAKESIHIEYFHFGNDEGSKKVREMLMKKASEGVKVRFLNENIANLPILPSYYNKMKKSGVEVKKFTNTSNLLNLIASLNYRNHRKIVVIDGKIGYTGGMNINDKYFKQWRDTHLRMTGEAVASLQSVFLDSWLASGGELDKPVKEYFPTLYDVSEPKYEEGNLHDKKVHVVLDEPDISWPLIQMGYEWALIHAKKYFYIQTPYFIPPEPLLDALKAAALSGAEICLMVPEKADNPIARPTNKSYYEECLKAGIRIFLKSGQFCHAKTFVTDDYLSSVGTANMDHRSFHLAYEVNTYIYDEETAKINKEIFMKDLESCRELDYETWSKRPFYQKFIQHFFRLFAPLI